MKPKAWLDSALYFHKSLPTEQDDSSILRYLLLIIMGMSHKHDREECLNQLYTDGFLK